MAIIKEVSPEQKSNPASFEEVEEVKAKLFHSRKETFQIFGIRQHLRMAMILALLFGALAAFPFIRTVTDMEAVVIPARIVDVEALKAGEITEVSIQGGDLVQKGQVLAKIVSSSDDLEIEKVRAEIGFVKTQIERVNARRIYGFERYESDRTLLKKGAISKDEFLASELAFKDLEQERKKLAGQLAWLEQKLSLLAKEKESGVVKATISGTVISDVEMKQETFAAKGEFILSLASEEQRIEFLLRQQDYGRIEVGNAAQVRFYAFPGQHFQGEVVQVKHYAEAVAWNGVRTNAIKVLIELNDFPKDVRNGMFAKVKIRGRAVSLIGALLRRI